MSSFNRIVVIGNLTRDPELKEVGQSQLCKMGIAINRKTPKGDDVCFMDVVVWGSLAALCGKYLTKGKQALVEGYIKQENWQDATGQKRSKHVIVAEEVQFLGSASQDKPRESDYKNGDLPF